MQGETRQHAKRPDYARDHEGMSEEERQQRQARLDAELSELVKNHDLITFKLPPLENGSCSGDIHIITQFPILPEELPEIGEDVVDKLDLERDRDYAKQKGKLHFQRRQEEYMDTLRKNLRNPYVKRIHLLLERASDIDFILGQGVPDMCNKLHPVELGRRMHYNDAFHYANKHLPGEVCLVMNADTYMAEGFQFASKTLFTRKAKPHSTDLALSFVDCFLTQSYISLRTCSLGGTFSLLRRKGDWKL